MLEHIVLFRWKEGTLDSQKQGVVKALLALQHTVPSIRSISAGMNFSNRSDGFETGLVVRFDDQAGLDAYQIHPEHQKVVQEYVRPIADKILAVDYLF